MTELQLEELNYIDLLFKEKLATLGFATHVNSASKTQNGYTLRRICIKKSCHSNWSLRVKVPSGSCTITRNHNCDHD